MAKKDTKRDMNAKVERASSSNTGRGNSESARTAQTSQSASSSRGRTRRDSNRNGGRQSDTAGTRPVNRNSTLDAFTIETPIHGETILFPSDSAAAQAFGTYTVSPGMENFIEMWTQVRREPSTATYSIVAGPFARRTANAMCIEFVPYFGSLDANVENTFLNPIRVAALNLKQFIDTSFGTNTAYDPADLMAYIMAVAAVWTYAAEIKRDIRLVYTYLNKQFPQFLPMGLFALLGIGNMSHSSSAGEGYLWTSQQLRSLIDQLNRVLVMFNRLPMPPEMTIFGYNDDLFEGLFTDTPDLDSAQLYVFKSAGYWKYSSTGSIRGSRLKYSKALPGMSIENKIQTLAEMVEALTALRTSDTAMLQNLYNAYGSKDTARVGLLDINGLQGLPLLYHEGVLTMIENCCWGKTVPFNYSAPTDVQYAAVTDIEVDSASSNLNGHVFCTANNAARWPNLPLQFHKPITELTNSDIGWALRMHPVFTALKNITVTNRADEEVTVPNAMTCDGMVGFAIPSTISVASFNNDGTFNIQNWFTREGQSEAGAWYESVFNDFRHSPIFVGTDFENNSLLLNWYNAERDVEFSYRLGDLMMYWTYLTQDVYAGNVVREVQGTRKF